VCVAGGLAAENVRGNEGSLHTEHVRSGLLSGFSILVYPLSNDAMKSRDNKNAGETTQKASCDWRHSHFKVGKGILSNATKS
jgi:hypothetical protein